MAVFIATGCSGGSPTALDAGGESIPQISAVDSSPGDGLSRMLWGYYDVSIDIETGNVEVVPIREASFHLNAISFLEPPALSGLSIDNSTLEINLNDNYVAVDVILNHPFPGLDQYTGFDVRGILIAPGGNFPFDDQSLIFPPDDGVQLVNADGMTRWWNPLEFQGGGIFGFKAGLLGKPGGAGLFTSTINGYKLFADGLGPQSQIDTIPGNLRGAFLAGSSNRRNYQISFGNQKFLTFQYAIDASWAAPFTFQDPEVPEDFPLAANAVEGYAITVLETENTLWWLEGIGNGGSLKMDINVYTWRPMSVTKVAVELDKVTDQIVEALVVPGSGPTEGGAAFSTYQVEIEPTTLAQTGKLDCLIRVETAEYYDQKGMNLFYGPPAAQITSYLHKKVDISFVPPLIWEVENVATLPEDPFTDTADISVIGSGPEAGVYFMGDEYEMKCYPLNYSGPPECKTKLSGTFGFSVQDIYGPPKTVGRFDLAQTGHFVITSASAAPSPTPYGGLKRDYVSFYTNDWTCNGQIPAQVALPDILQGYFQVIDIAANWSASSNTAKVYWIQVDDPAEDTPPNEEITVILGVYQHEWSGNPFTGDIDYISGSTVPKGSGPGLVDITTVSRFAVDSDPVEVFGSTDLITWYLESSPPALECFSVVSQDSSGDFNESLTTVTNFLGTPRDIAVMPTHTGGYSLYNWVIVLEEGAGGTWMIESFDQHGNQHVVYDQGVGYPANFDVDPYSFTLHVWCRDPINDEMTATVLNLTLG